MKKLLTLALSLLCTLACAAQTPDNTPLNQRIVFNVTSVQVYNPQRGKKSKAPIIDSPSLLVFRQHEVRYNNRVRWADFIYPVVKIEGRHHFKVTTWDCGDRTYTLWPKKHQVTMTRLDTPMVKIYYGSINYTVMFRHDPTAAPAPVKATP
jgi:hypothetical protein